MRIGINLMSENDRLGGIGNYVRSLFSSIPKFCPHDTPIYVFSNRDYPLNNIFQQSPYRLITIKAPLSSAFLRRLFEQFIFPFYLLVYRIGIVHSVNNTSPVVYFGKTVVTILDLSAIRTGHRFGLMKRLYLIFFSYLSAKLANKIITISEASKRDIQTCFSISPCKITRTYLGVSQSFFQPDDGQTSNETLRKLDIRKNYIFFVGTMEPGKNIRRLYEAYDRLDDYLKEKHELVLCGYNDILEPEIKNELLGDSKVRLLGYVSQEELCTLYKNAYVFTLVSLNEGFGLPIIEAMASGAPVLTSNVSSMPEIAGNAALFVNPYSIDDICNGLRSLLTDDELRKSLIAKGRNRALEFSWEKCAIETYKVYDEILKGTK